MVSRARALAPALRERAEEGERLRYCPRASVDDFFAAELNKALIPARFGGYEMGWDVLCEMAMAMAHGCAAQGWVLTVYGDHAQQMGMFGRRAQDDVWGADPRALISTSFGAQGKARRVAGGAVLSG
jgi:3-hydroxy-9,10-secoandrosta-1,3,5(10)-triene-9,17-dione monooxygenase